MQQGTAHVGSGAASPQTRYQLSCTHNVQCVWKSDRLVYKAATVVTDSVSADAVCCLLVVLLIGVRNNSHVRMAHCISKAAGSARSCASDATRLQLLV